MSMTALRSTYSSRSLMSWRSSTSRNTLTSGMSSCSCRLIVATASWPVDHTSAAGEEGAA
eukprot:7380899-Prymnesium_polylepis.1